MSGKGRAPGDAPADLPVEAPRIAPNTAPAASHPAARLAAPDAPFAPPPVLETARLRLRAPVAADWPHYRALLTSPRSQYMGGPCDLRLAWGWFCHDCALWPLYGHGALVLTLREGGPPLGSVQINDGALFPETELGWQLFDGAEGRGYATEAAAALRAWAFGPRGLTTLVSYIDPGNAASIAVAERLGAVLDPQAQQQDPGDLVYRHMPG